MLRILRLRSILVPSYYAATNAVSARCVQTAPRNFGLFGPPQEESLMKRVAKRFGWTETSRSVSKAKANYYLTISIIE